MTRIELTKTQQRSIGWDCSSANFNYLSIITIFFVFIVILMNFAENFRALQKLEYLREIYGDISNDETNNWNPDQQEPIDINYVEKQGDDEEVYIRQQVMLYIFLYVHVNIIVENECTIMYMIFLTSENYQVAFLMTLSSNFKLPILDIPGQDT
ncbi:hypothetical protein ACJX0J_028455 [Zea mays]